MEKEQDIMEREQKAVDARREKIRKQQKGRRQERATQQQRQTGVEDQREGKRRQTQSTSH